MRRPFCSRFTIPIIWSPLGSNMRSPMRSPMRSIGDRPFLVDSECVTTVIKSKKAALMLAIPMLIIFPLPWSTTSFSIPTIRRSLPLSLLKIMKFSQTNKIYALLVHVWLLLLMLLGMTRTKQKSILWGLELILPTQWSIPRGGWALHNITYLSSITLLTPEL